MKKFYLIELIILSTLLQAAIDTSKTARYTLSQEQVHELLNKIMLEIDLTTKLQKQFEGILQV